MYRVPPTSEAELRHRIDSLKKCHPNWHRKPTISRKIFAAQRLIQAMHGETFNDDLPPRRVASTPPPPIE